MNATFGGRTLMKSEYKYLVGLMLVITALGCSVPQKSRLTIAAAANMQYALTEIIGVYNAQNNTQHEAVFSSSGKLNAQIKQGAPFDVFLSADMGYAQDLYDSKFSNHPPKVYAYGTLVMWSYQENFELNKQALRSELVKHIALANPRTAPYGRAAKEYLLGEYMYKELTPKYVYGEGIGQTNQFITSGAAEIGFTAKSVVVAGPMEGKGTWKEIDPGFYSPIAQGWVVINTTKKETEAQKFLAFLKSKTVKIILKKYGYDVP